MLFIEAAAVRQHFMKAHFPLLNFERAQITFIKGIRCKAVTLNRRLKWYQAVFSSQLWYCIVAPLEIEKLDFMCTGKIEH